MVWIVGIFSFIGINFTFWLLVGIVRLVYENMPKPHVDIRKKRGRPVKPITVSEVACILPAHNEEGTIGKTLDALKKVLPQENIFVVSDYSTDKTAWIATGKGTHVLDIHPNIGKAKAIVHAMKYYKLPQRFKAILIHDADVEIDEDYMKYALPFFNDKEIAAVTPHQESTKQKYGFLEMYYIAYRLRLWKVLQFGMRFGMTWKFTNVTYIIPGGLSIYRSNVIKKLQIDAPNLIIEDFNMTFEVRKKKLGKVAYSSKIKGYSQDPYTFHDYVKQVRRWNIGFWQAVGRNGVWPSLFWVFVGSFMAEMIFYAFFVLAIPFLAIYLALTGQGIEIFGRTINWPYLLIGVFAIDYVLTIIAAVAEKKPAILFYGFGFFFLRYVDSLIFLYSIPLALMSTSTGVWTSPSRKASASLAT